MWFNTTTRTPHTPGAFSPKSPKPGVLSLKNTSGNDHGMGFPEQACRGP